jgi:hypothetical protein
MKKNKIYGYMVGYREIGSRFVRYYTTFTRRQALASLLYYKKAPPRERESNRPLVDPVWEIQPITKKEIMRSILDEIPFLYKCIQIYLYRWAHCSIVKTQSQREKIFDFLPILLLSQKFLSFFADFGATLNSYMVYPFSLCYFGPADKGKIIL